MEKTGMSYDAVMNMPYVVFVLTMLDAPYVDYNSDKKEHTKKRKPFGTPISKLPKDIQNQLK